MLLLIKLKNSLENGKSLKKSKKSLPGGIDSQKTFLPFDASENAIAEHPPQTLRVRLSLETPPPGAKTIEVLEGEFKILTSTKEPEVVTVENAPQSVKRVNPDHKAKGIKLLRRAVGDTDSFEISCTKEHFVGRVMASPGDLKSVSESQKGLTVQRISAGVSGGKFPDDTELSFNYYENVEEQTITFRFENIPLPQPTTTP